MSLDWLLLPQLQAFAASGYDVVAMSAPDDHVAAISAEGIEHVSIPALTRAVSPARDWRALRQLQRAFREVAPDIVHTVLQKADIYGRVAAASAGLRPILWTLHECPYNPEVFIDNPALNRFKYGVFKWLDRCKSCLEPFTTL